MSVTYNSAQPPATGKFNLDWVGEAWAWWKAAPGVYIGATLLLIFIDYAASFAMGFVFAGSAALLDHSGSSGTSASSLATFVGNIVTSLLTMPITGWSYACIIGLALRQIRGEQITFGDLFKGGKYWWPMTIVVFGHTVLLYAGLLMCIIGAFFTSCLVLPAFGMVADGIPLGEAWSRSMEVTKRDWKNGGSLMLRLTGVGLLGVLVCLVGVLAAWPMMAIVAALAYRDMIGWGPQNDFNAFESQGGVWPPAPTQPQPNSDVPGGGRIE